MLLPWHLGPTALRPAILVLALLTACGDASHSGTGVDAGGAGEIQGTVALVKTGDPVSNAVVVLLKDGHVLQATASDAAGAFSFAAVPAGSYAVHLTGLELTGADLLHTSFAPLTQQVTVSNGSATVYFGGAGLVPARIDGFVYCHGAASPGARLRVVGGATDTTVTTNAQGKYGSPSLVAGAYAVLLVGPPAGCAYAPPFQATTVRTGQLVHVDFRSD